MRVNWLCIIDKSRPIICQIYHGTKCDRVYETPLNASMLIVECLKMYNVTMCAVLYHANDTLKTATKYSMY